MGKSISELHENKKLYKEWSRQHRNRKIKMYSIIIFIIIFYYFAGAITLILFLVIFLSVNKLDNQEQKNIIKEFKDYGYDLEKN